MGLFGCPHKKWVRYGGRNSRQERCSKCGKLRMAKPPLFHTHTYSLKRGTCNICGKPKG